MKTIQTETSRFVLIALDRWTRMVSCPTAQKDDNPPVVVNDLPFLSTLSLDVIPFLPNMFAMFDVVFFFQCMFDINFTI